MNLKELKQNDSKTEGINNFNRSNKASKKPDISFSLDNRSSNKSNSPLTSFNLNQSKKRKSRFAWLKKILIIILLITLLSGSYVGYLYYQKYRELQGTGIENVNLLDPFQYALSAVSQNKKIDPLESLLQTNGRTNFLLMGVDARFGFSDSFRTDSLIIASYRHATNEVLQISIPRDMQAKYYNTVTKINAVFQFTYNENKAVKKSEEEILKASFNGLSNSVKEVTGLDIHYGVMINFRGLKDVVDTLGGITVDVDTPLWDNLFPNDSDTGVITIYFPKGVTQMNGTKALQYARSRETTSDYDRARRQQKVINAIREKFLSSNFFTDPSKINDVLTALTKNIKFFNISSSEINTMVQGKDLLKTLNSYSVVLDPNIGSFTGSILKGGQPIEGAGFLVYPVGGKYDELKSVVEMYLDSPKLLSEDANVVLIWTNSKRYKDFTRIGQYVLDSNLPFIMRYDFIKTTTPIAPTGTATASPSPTPTSLPNSLSIYTNGNKPETLNFYEKLFKDNNQVVTKKDSAELPKELEKIFKESDILIVVD